MLLKLPGSPQGLVCDRICPEDPVNFPFPVTAETGSRVALGSGREEIRKTGERVGQTFREASCRGETCSPMNVEVQVVIRGSKVARTTVGTRSFPNSFFFFKSRLRCVLAFTKFQEWPKSARIFPLEGRQAASLSP